MSLPKPYYEEGDEDHRIVIYHADCREILPELPTVEMMFTDPPYGVGYDGGHFHSGDVKIKRSRRALVGDTAADLYAEFLPLALVCVDGPCYMMFAGTRGGPVYRAVERAGGVIHALIVWNKTNATYAAMGAQYKQRHEPCLYFKPKGASLRWCGPSNECTVWHLARDSVNVFHPTQKPVELSDRAIRNHDVTSVLDPFVGSGSTLLSAKKAGIRAIGIEIEERYCKIAAKRLAQEVFHFEE
jgi:site-specific DNA-methyltransferase (adenine-specific)